MKLYPICQLLLCSFVFFCITDLSTNVIIIVQNLFGLTIVLILYSWLVYSTLFLREMPVRDVSHRSAMKPLEIAGMGFLKAIYSS